MRTRDPNRLMRALLAVLLLRIPPTAISQSPTIEPWPVKEFEIFFGKPAMSTGALAIPGVGGVTVENAISIFSGVVDMDNEMSPSIPLNANRMVIEAYLNEVANELEKMGFKPPLLEPVVENDEGRPAFRVYYHDFNFAPAAYRNPDCGRSRPTIWISATNFIVGGQIPPKSFQDLGHELFHAVQQRYPLFEPHCGDGPGGWITEGTAQAVGADLAAYSTHRLNFPHRSTGTWPRDRWGRRAYDASLFARGTGGNAYQAASFWRYLGEYSSLSGGAGTTSVEPDYTYLIDFFKSDHAMPVTNETAMTWIDKQLRDMSGKFKLGLTRVYPNFVTTFAAYGGTRHNPPEKTAAENRKEWIDNVFPVNTCPDIPLSQQSSTHKQALKIAAVAAECFKVNWPRSQAQGMQVRADGESKAQLQALTLGMKNGQAVAQPIVVTTVDAWAATWLIALEPGSDPVELIVSNVAANAAKTGEFDGEIAFTAPHWQNTFVPQGPMPPPAAPAPAQQPGSQGGVVTMETQRQRVAAEIMEGLETLNPNLVHSTTVVPQPNAMTCNDPFVATPCGPTTMINLQYVPGIYGALSQSAGRGGLFGQFSTTLSGVGAAGTAEFGAKVLQAEELAESTPGTRVNIQIPLIDYGFTGSFDNASLRVNGAGDDNYESIGPHDIMPGEGTLYPLAGKVTIDEYTPWLMRGSFSGHLVNTNLLGFLEGDPSLPVHEQISGEFHIVATWREDERIQVETAETAFIDAMADLQELMAGTGAGTEQAILDAQQDGSGPGTIGSVGSAFETMGVCLCSCETRDELPPECQEHCSQTLEACDAGDATMAGALTSSGTSTSGGGFSGEPFLRSMPDACTLLDEARARSVLNGASPPQLGTHEWQPRTVSECAYLSADASHARTELVMMFQPLVITNSHTMPPDRLRTMAGLSSGLPGATPVDVDGVGNAAFGMVSGETAVLKVFTGIYGTARDSDEAASELVLTYTLIDETRSGDDLLRTLSESAKPQMEKLEEISRTTHEGA